MDKTVWVRVDGSIWDWLKSRADQEDRPVSAVIRRAVKAAMEASDD